LEGSIRRDSERVRINAQLIDAVTGAHRWAERYDRGLRNVFAVQDELTRTIVTILSAHVNKAEAARVLLKPPATWEAYDCYLRGAEAYFSHLKRRTTATLYDARRLFEQSLSIDPDYARAYGMLSFTYVHTYIEPLDDDYDNLATLDRAHELATMAVHLDANLPEAHAHLGWVLLWRRQHETAIAEFERAFALNPNFIDDRFSYVLANAGEPERAVEACRRTCALIPFRTLVDSVTSATPIICLGDITTQCGSCGSMRHVALNCRSPIFGSLPHTLSLDNLTMQARRQRR
jgi:adenylate cyclase